MLEMLEQGGDRLVFVNSRYEIPIYALVLPMLGSPTVELRHFMGAAGVGSLPKLEQELSAGLRLSVLRFEALPFERPELLLYVAERFKRALASVSRNHR